MFYVYFHIDFDAFFASIEETLNPALQNKPLVVSSLGHAAVVCAANYLARSYGVSAGMPTFKAKFLLPKNANYVEPRINIYSSISKKIFSYIRNNYCRKINVFSIDECSLEFKTNNSNWYKIFLRKAKNIQDDIFNKFHLSASIGIGKSEFIAKMASNVNKPYGLTLIKNTEDFKNNFWHLPINKMFMIGNKLAEELNEIGIFTIKDLAVYKNKDDLKKILTKDYIRYIEQANGNISISSKKIQNPKSFSIKRTFSSDIAEEDGFNHINWMSNSIFNFLYEARAKFKRITCIIEFSNNEVYKKNIDFQIPKWEKNDILNQCYLLFDNLYIENSKLIKSINYIVTKLVYLDLEDQLLISDLDNLTKQKKMNLNWQLKVINLINNSIDDNVASDASKIINKSNMHFHH